MSKSDNIYNALDFARNKLKSAAEAKGAAVASPYSLMDIAAAVQTIENGLEVGVLVSDSTGLKVQPLEFSGTTATANGAAESYTAKIFNTGKAEPAYSSGGDTSAFESAAMAIIGTPTEEGGDIEPISQKYMTVTSTDDVGCGVGIEFTGTIQIVEDGVATLYTTSPISNIALRNATVYGDNITYFNCGSTNLASVDPSHNDQLVTLICSNGYLTALDISNNSLLTTLEANSNNLSSAVVDKILSDLVAHGKSNGLLRLENSAGIGAASNGARRARITLQLSNHVVGQ